MNFTSAACADAANVWQSCATTTAVKQWAGSDLHIPVDLLHELLLLLLSYIHLLHVVPEIHVLKGRKLLSLWKSNTFSAAHLGWWRETSWYKIKGRTVRTGHRHIKWTEPGWFFYPFFVTCFTIHQRTLEEQTELLKKKTLRTCMF